MCLKVLDRMKRFVRMWLTDANEHTQNEREYYFELVHRPSPEFVDARPCMYNCCK